MKTMALDTMQKNPRAWDGHYNLGVALLGEGKVKEALVQFTRALDLSPFYSNIYLNIGCILCEQGRPRGCPALFREGPGHGR